MYIKLFKLTTICIMLPLFFMSLSCKHSGNSNNKDKKADIDSSKNNTATVAETEFLENAVNYNGLYVLTKTGYQHIKNTIKFTNTNLITLTFTEYSSSTLNENTAYYTIKVIYKITESISLSNSKLYGVKANLQTVTVTLKNSADVRSANTDGASNSFDNRYGVYRDWEKGKEKDVTATVSPKLFSKTEDFIFLISEDKKNITVSLNCNNGISGEYTYTN